MTYFLYSLSNCEIKINEVFVKCYIVNFLGACSESLMATQSSSARARRGRRQPRELRIETYSRNDEEDETPGPPALLPEGMFEIIIVLVLYLQHIR